MPMNSIFNTYHSILRYFDKAGIVYTTQNDGRVDVPQWMYEDCPVSMTINPFYGLETVRIIMWPGIEYVERDRQEMINLANLLNLSLGTSTLIISPDGDLLVRDSLDAMINAVEHEFVHRFLLRMASYVITYMEISPLIVKDGKNAIEAHAIWMNLKNEEAAKSPGGEDGAHE